MVLVGRRPAGPRILLAADPELDDPRAYYGANYGRLKRIKTTYDPYGDFLFS
jgi:Berberine and berberine like